MFFREGGQGCAEWSVYGTDDWLFCCHFAFFTAENGAASSKLQMQEMLASSQHQTESADLPLTTHELSNSGRVTTTNFRTGCSRRLCDDCGLAATRDRQVGGMQRSECEDRGHS